jgi:GNAT superfamily N-acetyltransferase
MKIIRICENFSIHDISKGEEIEKNQLLQKRENEEKPIKDFEKLQKSLGVDSYLSILNNGNIKLHNLRVEKEMRKQGLGTTFMDELCRIADEMGKTIELDLASKERGETTSKNRLIEFYRRFGFVRNFGRTKDYQLSCQMYRTPKNF